MTTIANSLYPPEVVGLIPAAGMAQRLAPIPCSKEIYPIGFACDHAGSNQRPKVACQYLLEAMRQADVRKAYLILRQGKWDIPAYLGDGTIVDMQLAYLMMNLPFGPPYTLDQAFPFVSEVLVAFGFPDILFHNDCAFHRLISHQKVSVADMVLGLFPANQPATVDMVDVDHRGLVREIVVKPSKTSLKYSWCIAVWSPAFTGFLHSYVRAESTKAGELPECTVGSVIQAAIRDGVRVVGLVVSDQPYLDIGTPHGLAEAVSRFGLVG